MDIHELNNKIKSCTLCSICKNGKVVIGRSNMEPVRLPVPLMVIGEAAGRHESETGIPFCGPSGKMLDSWLKVINLPYVITNVVKHRPVNETGHDRPPTPDEIANCLPYLKEQIKFFRPLRILLVGNTAYKTITGSELSITQSIKENKVYDYKYVDDNGEQQTAKVYVYYHPARILRQGTTNWQKDIDVINNLMTGSHEAHGEKLYSAAGISNAERIRKLQQTEIVSSKFSKFPIIGIKSSYSLLEYGGKFDDTLAYLKQNDAKFIAVADVNTIGSFLKLDDLRELAVKEIKDENGRVLEKIQLIKVGYGAEIKINKDFAFSNFITNQTGFENLNRILTYVNVNDGLKVEDVFNEIKDKNYQSGLLCVILPEFFTIENESYITKLIEIYGEENTYIGCIPTNNIKTKIKANYLINKYPKILPIIYQNNLYDTKDKYPIYCAIKAIKYKQKYYEVLNKGYDNDRYLKGIDDVTPIFKELTEALITNTENFANRLNFTLRKYHNLMPKTDIDWEKLVGSLPTQAEIEQHIIDTNLNLLDEPKEVMDKRAINEISFKKLVYKLGIDKIRANYPLYAAKFGVSLEEAERAYEERIDHELEIFFSKEFIDYIMMCKDIYDFVKSKNITRGSGRGSAAGSLVLFMLDIVQLDGMLNGLFFERFVNEVKAELPDIDMDFPSSVRQEIIEYVTNKYGADRVMHIKTYLHFAPKTAMNYAADILDTPKWVINEINKKIVTRTSGDARFGHEIEDTFEFYPELNKLKIQYPDFFNLSLLLEGIEKTIGTHASGIAILKEPYWKYYPLTRSSSEIVTDFEHGELEKLGLVKLDILGLTELDIIDSIAKKNNIKVNYTDPNNDGSGTEEKAVIDVFRLGNTAGIFEAQSPAFTAIGKQIVDSFKDIVALNAIVRPAPQRYNVHTKYAQFKRTGKTFLVHPLVDDLFKEYGGLIIFQEQVMIMTNKIGNFYTVDSNSLIKSISKSKGIITFNTYREKFIRGAESNGISVEEASKLFDSIFQFGSFAFNKSHALSYAYIMYYTAWLKTHYANDFYEFSLLHSNFVEKRNLITEMKRLGYKVMQPDINKSDISRLVIEEDKKTFILPLRDIKYMSLNKATEIVENRPYNSITEMVEKCKITPHLLNSINNLVYKPVNEMTLDEVISRLYNDVVVDAAECKERLNSILSSYVNNIMTYKEMVEKRISSAYVVILVEKKPKINSWGDWLPEMKKPSDEEIMKDRKKYAFIDKYGWFAKFAKVSAIDLDGERIYIKAYPPVFSKYNSVLSELKANKVILVKLKITIKSDGEIGNKEILEAYDLNDVVNGAIKNSNPSANNMEIKFS